MRCHGLIGGDFEMEASIELRAMMGMKRMVKMISVVCYRLAVVVEQENSV